VTEHLVCCQNLGGAGNAESPFKMITLAYYDGPTAGIAQCQCCPAEYRFMMVDWDDDQDVRIHAFAPLPAGSFMRVENILAKYEPTEWPTDKEIDEILGTAEAATMVVALSQWGEKILAARSLAEGDLKDIQDWFSLENPQAARDWFSFLGLVRKIDNL
jgi:hypothetical protein